MAIANFKPTIWSGQIQLELNKAAVLVDFCNREFEGDAKKGSKVKILNVNMPTVQKYTGAKMVAEEIADTSVFLDIDQADAFYVKVDDVDKVQSVKSTFEKFTKQGAKAIKYAAERFIALTGALGAGAYSTSSKIDTAIKAKNLVDSALLWLRENDVQLDDDVAIEIPPFMYQFLKDIIISIDTNNSEMISKGFVGRYDGAKVRVSNLLHNDGTDDYCMVRTNMAIAYADQMAETEAERPDGVFEDAVKSLHVYGAKVVRPKELYVIKAHK